jgi:hypothetical protein
MILNPQIGLERARMPAIASLPPSLSLEALSTPEGTETLARAIIEKGGIKPGCRALGLDPGTIFYRMHRNPEFAAKVQAARASMDQQILETISELEDTLMNLRGAERTNERISAIREVLHSLRWRIGRTSKVYGDKPANVTNIQNNVGITCDAKTRAELIALREQIKATPTPPLLEEPRGYTLEIADAELAHETQD